MVGLEMFVPEIADAPELWASAGMPLFDRGFLTGPMIEAPNTTRFDWVMPCRNTPTVRNALAGAGAGAHGKVVQVPEPARTAVCKVLDEGGKKTQERRG